MLRVYAAIAALAVLAGAAFYVHRLQVKAGRMEAAEAKLVQVEAKSKADLAALQAAWDHERTIAKEASDDYESRLQALSVARADTPVRSVRLCRSPTGYVPAPGPTASGIDSGSPAEQPQGAGQDPQVGRDIGPELYALADRADETAAQCNSLIRWVKSR